MTKENCITCETPEALPTPWFTPKPIYRGHNTSLFATIAYSAFDVNCLDIFPVKFTNIDHMMPHTAVNGLAYTTQDGWRSNFDVAARHAPVTYKRVQAINSDDKLEKPSIARANAAVSNDKPNGEPEQVKKFKDYVSNSFHSHPRLSF